MPRRRHHHRLHPRSTSPQPAGPTPEQAAEIEVDRGWHDHQQWEAQRRAPLLVSPPPKPRPKPFDIWAVLAKVEADFARWEQERQQT